tara:strand:- start:45834 stop:47168 length:1335 start_codon:yes stop_codon:yes gene_type:complete
MKSYNRLPLLLLIPFFLFNSLKAQDPTRFVNEIQTIQNKDFQIDKSKEVVVFTGSSSVRMWRNVPDVFPTINALNTGFGGSEFSDLIHYRKELIFDLKPDRIFIYEGDNDVSSGKSPETILADAKKLLSFIRGELPSVPIYFISPKPSISRWELEDQYLETNLLLKELAESNENVNYIDVWYPMLNESGEPISDIFIEDNLHMNAKGYKIWEDVISKEARLITRNQIISSYNQWNKKQNDWANFERFKDENTMIKPPASNENRVVFMGNSITQGWADTVPEFFEDNPYIERGISGQTTPQMLVRFRQDVIDLQPKVVVILAGTNDIAGNTGQATNKMIQDNLASMAELAHSNGIKVVLSSILPAYDYPWRKGTLPSQRIIDINNWLKEYSDMNGHVYLDYWTPMADERNGMKSEYTYDGVHVTKEGYLKMQSLVVPAINKALSK